MSEILKYLSLASYTSSLHSTRWCCVPTDPRHPLLGFSQALEWVFRIGKPVMKLGRVSLRLRFSPLQINLKKKFSKIT